MMSTSLVSLNLVLLFGLALLQTSPEELIVGLWRHRKNNVFLAFFKNGGMYFKIPSLQGAYEIYGKYNLMDKNLLKIELDSQYGAISGEPIFTNRQVLKVTIHKDKIVFHDLRINESDEQIFTRIK